MKRRLSFIIIYEFYINHMSVKHITLLLRQRFYLIERTYQKQLQQLLLKSNM